MRLYLTVAVLLLAFVAYTEAQEETMEERFSQFNQKMSEFGQSVAETAKAALEKINNNENVQKAKDWFQQQWEKLQSN